MSITDKQYKVIMKKLSEVNAKKRKVFWILFILYMIASLTCIGVFVSYYPKQTTDSSKGYVSKYKLGDTVYGYETFKNATSTIKKSKIEKIIFRFPFGKKYNYYATYEVEGREFGYAEYREENLYPTKEEALSKVNEFIKRTYIIDTLPER